jgi:hypothetical protein
MVSISSRTESEDTIRPTWGASTGDGGASLSGTATVGAWEIELSSSPHEEQKRVSGKFSAEHFWH